MRLWLRWALLAAFVAVLSTVFVSLGEWQLDRLHQRQARNLTIEANVRAPVQPYGEVFTHPITTADEWQRVEAHGVFDAGHQFVVRYRGNGGDKGYEVVTPLITSSGAVLVDRGFLAVRSGMPLPASAPAPPSGEVTIVGHVRRNEQGRRAAVTPTQGQLRLISAPAIQAALPYPVADGYIGAVTVEPGQSEEFRAAPLPELSDGPHLWYAIQWFMFTALAVTGIVVFVRGDLQERRKPAAPGGPAVVPRSRHGSRAG